MEGISKRHEVVKNRISVLEPKKYPPTYFSPDLKPDVIDLPYQIVENVADIKVILKYPAERVLRLYYLKLVANLNEDIANLASAQERKK